MNGGRDEQSVQPISTSRLASLERELPLDDISVALADVRIRYTLYYLDAAGMTTLETLTDFLTGIDASVSGSVQTSSDWRHTRAALHHDVLPRLEDLGFVVYESKTETITATGWPAAVTRLLQIADSSVFETRQE